jgi:hypothetical protein
MSTSPPLKPVLADPFTYPPHVYGCRKGRKEKTFGAKSPTHASSRLSDGLRFPLAVPVPGTHPLHVATPCVIATQKNLRLNRRHQHISVDSPTRLLHSLWLAGWLVPVFDSWYHSSLFLHHLEKKICISLSYPNIHRHLHVRPPPSSITTYDLHDHIKPVS